MSRFLITLTTDFGEGSLYVAAMKGTILGIAPEANLVDLGHQIPPQDLRHAAFFLAASLPYFPQGSLHVVVVDPGVGTRRDILYVEHAGQRLLVPDNGCWTWFRADLPTTRVIRVTENRFWRTEVSNTFHGRDIFAPVAGHLAQGVDPSELGPTTHDWARLEYPAWTKETAGLRGEVIYVDRYGNIISNIPATEMPMDDAERFRVEIARQTLTRFVRAYGEADAGDLVALISSFGTLEVASVESNAAEQLGVGVGDPVTLFWDEE